MVSPSIAFFFVKFESKHNLTCIFRKLQAQIRPFIADGTNTTLQAQT